MQLVTEEQCLCPCNTFTQGVNWPKRLLTSVCNFLSDILIKNIARIIFPMVGFLVLAEPLQIFCCRVENQQSVWKEKAKVFLEQ